MRLLQFLFISILFISCQEDSNTFTVAGKAMGFPDGARVYVFEIDENKQPKAIDTLIVQEGMIKGEYAKSDVPSMNFVKADYTNGNVFYFPENSDLKVILYKDSITASTFKGSPQNDGFTSFKHTLVKLEKENVLRSQAYNRARKTNDQAGLQEYARENLARRNDVLNHKLSFIENNPNSIYTPLLIQELMQKRSITPSKAMEELEKLSPKIAATGIVKNTKKSIALLKNSEIGGEAPAFTASTPDDQQLALKDALGEYTIIDFWASWCRPCRMENPNVVKVYNEYHDKGLNIISVSLDRPGQKAQWMKAIEADKMDWYHVSNLQFWNDPIAKAYGVRSIPATFLLDKDGKIIDKNLRGPALGNRIAALLGDK